MDCAAGYVEGRPTDDVYRMDNETGCVSPGGYLVRPGGHQAVCITGATLYTHNGGWGFVGDVWHEHASPDRLLPPFDVLAECPSG